MAHYTCLSFLTLKKRKPLYFFFSDTGARTRVFALKGRCPDRLDYNGLEKTVYFHPPEI